MDCAGFEALLFVGLDCEAVPAERESMVLHQQSCEHCRRLAALVTGAPESDATGVADDELTTAILMRTSGKPCDQAAALLADSGDEAADTDPLLRRHIASCAECAALERALVQMRRKLPALAEADPGPDFASSVLRATIPAVTDERARTFHPAKARASRASVWQRLARRPRIALEGSYLVAMLVLLVVGLPGESDSENAAQALDAWWRERAAAAGELIENFDSSAQAVWDEVLAPQSDHFWSIWNENAAGDVEPDAMD